MDSGHELLHYRLVEKIGEGGMGEVWKAEDTVLDRRVAIKILPQAVAGDPDRLARFEREARLVASLNHANIAVVHGLHEAGGVRFLAMELVSGADLSRRLDAGALPLAEALRIARGVARAIESAHARGVMHRDLKPANIRVTPEGEVKVLDFGLAKALTDEPPGVNDATRTSAPTEIGTILGTAGYMSPEQARAQPVDSRSDTWAFGCVLFEMLAGRPAFGGGTLSDRLAAVLKEDPEWDALPASTPAGVRGLVRDCLQKDAGARPAEMTEVRARVEAALADLSTGSGGAPATRRGGLAWGGIAAAVVLVAVGAWWVGQQDRPTPAPVQPAELAIDPRSVAVLPFQNVAGDSDGEVFTAGIHDDVLTQLAKIGSLRTISRTSVLEYAESPKTIREIGRELGVATVVEGGVQRAGNLVRINVKLIDAASGGNLWAESYDRELTAENIFAIQSEIATAIATALRTELSPSEQRRLEAAPTDSLPAYEAYVQGTDFVRRPGSDPDDLLQAQRLLERAIELDPRFGLAYARLSEANADHYWMGGDPSEARLARAFEMARKAVEVAPDSGPAHQVLAQAHYIARDFDRAFEELAVAEELVPGDSEVIKAKAAFNRRTGRWERARVAYDQALSVDPRDIQTWLDTGLTYHYLGRYAEAVPYYDGALRLSPTYLEARLYRAIARFNLDPDPERCRSEIDGIEPTTAWRSVMTGYAWRLGMLCVNDQVAALLEPAGPFVTQQEFDYPRELLRAILLESEGDTTRSRAAYSHAVALLEPAIAGRPDYAHHHISLGLALAGLGRREEAIREGRRAVELLPVERDSLVGSWLLGDLAFVYLAAGEHDEALDTFERFFAHPSAFSAAAFARDPRVAPLRDHPRYPTVFGRR